MTKEEIMAIYEKAKQGDAQSQYEIGRLYATGNGVKQNEQQAALWYKKAAAQGHEQAQESIDGLSTGDVDTQDVKAAARNNDKQEVPMKFCGNCGTAIKEGDTFCGNCGAKDGVGGSAAKAIVIRFGETEQNRLFLIARKAAYISVALLSALIVIGVVCAFVYSGKTGKQPNTGSGLTAIFEEFLGNYANRYVQPIVNQLQILVEQYINQNILPAVIGFSVLLLFLMFTIVVMLLLLLSIEKNTRSQRVNNTDGGKDRKGA
ncbi:hypothetical protein FACS1894147_10540 [Spirochaetia bacterium]|nr:hypothetical protein FACS1894147_10540 [Spirochaetia bacterium]